MSKSSSADQSLAQQIEWEPLIELIRRGESDWNPKECFGPAAKDGSVYRWGIAVSTETACDDLVELLSRLACTGKVSKHRSRSVDLDAAISDWIELAADSRSPRPIDGTLSILWAASLPSLLERVQPENWRRLLESLLDQYESVLQRNDTASPLHLMWGGEMGLTLALCLPDVACCSLLKSTAAKAIRGWCRSDAESISASVASAVDARLVLASLIRSKRLIVAAGVSRFDKHAWKEMGQCLATWVAAMTTQGGCSALSAASKSDVADDRAGDGLMDHAAKFDRESLKPAMAAALGATPTGGRLAWEVSLPEAMHHDPDAKIAVMFPEWDVRRGRTHVDYSNSETRIEVYAGRAPILAGQWETSIEIEGQPQQPVDAWEEVCEYSDDDVHYLEIEQNWTGDLLVQRQLILLRDDRCLLLADAVLPTTETRESPSIRYTSRLPLGSSVESQLDEETREVFLSSGRKRAMALPLSACEWRQGATRCTLTSTEDRHLAMTVEGRGRLYAPLWIDFQPSRFKRNRTWRQLTVSDQLRIVGPDEAAAYRIQLGSEQWMVYRSLADRRCRSVLGKHLIADFYCSRFDAGDGSHDELITVDDSESSDD